MLTLEARPTIAPKWMPRPLSRDALLNSAMIAYAHAMDRANATRAQKGRRLSVMPERFTVRASGNFKKLGGAMVGVYSQTAGLSCIAYTASCLPVCYAGGNFFINNNWLKGATNFLFPDGAMAHSANLIAWLENPTEWEQALDAQLSTLALQGIKYFRINGAGDLLPGQAEAWKKLVGRHREIHFWGYTRSWADSTLLASILELGREPNISLWASLDRVNINYWLDLGMPLGLAAILVREERDYTYLLTKLYRAGIRDPRRVEIFPDHAIRGNVKGFYQIEDVRYTSCPKDRNIKAKVPITCLICRLCIDRAPRVPDKSMEG